jgi:hypothetical protein
MSAMGQKRTFMRVLPCLLYPQKRTFVGVSAMSALCQKRTLGGLLFDHFVGGDQKRRGIMGGILLKPAPAFSDPKNFQPPYSTNFLAMLIDGYYVLLAQIRTCLWPCVDW